MTTPRINKSESTHQIFQAVKAVPKAGRKFEVALSQQPMKFEKAGWCCVPGEPSPELHAYLQKSRAKSRCYDKYNQWYDSYWSTPWKVYRGWKFAAEELYKTHDQVLADFGKEKDDWIEQCTNEEVEHIILEDLEKEASDYGLI